ncbi:hypothetical protein ANCDUO_09908 [Ancylostoma duodenale]|uniref:Uncharacterized protein n=1 Tax=Ancylostoma duodenale TaxID=51022 RepID=A0A0C2GFD8_9BILA|nr:hypothetical protein ANCDUO_09908 [Ancylostoma duodenale]
MAIPPLLPSECNSTDSPILDIAAFQTVEQIKNGTYDTSPFNRSELIAPFIRYRETFQVARKYKLSSCQIEKVMSTISGSIFCYITNTTEFIANNRTISTEQYNTRLCLNQNLYENFTAVQRLLGCSKTEYAIVRDPTYYEKRDVFLLKERLSSCSLSDDVKSPISNTAFEMI